MPVNLLEVSNVRTWLKGHTDLKQVGGVIDFFDVTITVMRHL